MPKSILFPTDFSDTSLVALPIATILARQWDATLIIAHVIEGEKYPDGRWFQTDPEIPPEESTALVKIEPPDASVTCEHKILLGPDIANPPNPADEILDFAAERHVDAIVMGTHGRSGLAHFLMGSVAETVVQQATCPVIAVKHPHKERT